MMESSTILQRRALFNEAGDIELHKRRMVGGEHYQSQRL